MPIKIHIWYNLKTDENQLTARKYSGITIIIEVISIHVGDAFLCKLCCDVLFAFSRSGPSVQKEIYGKGGAEVVSNVKLVHKDNDVLNKVCNEILNLILSFQDINT